MNLKFGLKLWSTDTNYLQKARILFKKGFYQYIELYVVPQTYKKYVNYWIQLHIPFAIHVPHEDHGFNLSKKEKQKSNFILMAEVIKFANKLKAKKIVYHPGMNGDIREVVRQLKLIRDERLLIENLPYYGLNKSGVCHGATEEEIKYLLTATRTGFCLDVGHAIYSANAQKIDPWKYLKKLLEFSPKLFHLSDGDYSGKYDQHEHFGNGTFPLKELIKLLPQNAQITIETKKNSKNSLSDFVKDIKILRQILGKEREG